MMEPNTPQSEGGKARSLSLTPEERKAIASKAASARWSEAGPRATHMGEIKINGQEISCAVLSTGKRVLTQEAFLTSIGRAAKAKAGTGSRDMVDGLPPFLAAENLKPFMSKDLIESTRPLVFRLPSGVKAFGYDAALLPMVCEVYLNLRDSGKVTSNQNHIVKQCDILMRGLAHVGIIALVDEATGYQEERDRDALTKILSAYISAELMPYTKRFPMVFFKETYRIHGWEFDPGSSKRTPLVGKLINKWIYEQLPSGVLAELRRKNPANDNHQRKYKHFQFLTPDTGDDHLDRQITSVTTLLRAAKTKADFEEMFQRLFPQNGIHERIAFGSDPD